MNKIICADDDPLLRRLYQDLLGRKGYQVEVCSNGEEALEAFAKAPADLVILDLIMPGLSGLDICRELRRRADSFDVPVIMVSGVDAEASIVECLSCGADDYVLKPLHPTELLAKVATAIKRRRERLDRDAGLRPGTRFAGQFDIIRQIGAGGFSMVFHAWDTSRSQDIALKVFDLPPAQRNDKTFVSTFLREAYELSKLDYPTIVRFFDFGQSGVFHYLVMEYVQGRSLEEHMAAHGPLTEGQAAVVGHEVAGAIRYLAEKNMVHRDIKPPNIMLTQEGTIKLLDFGLARSVSDTTTSLRDEIRVTPFFAPPESFTKGGVLDAKSDVYSLAATLYYATSKVLPFDGDSVLSIITSHFKHVPTPLYQIRPKISRRFSDLVMQMMSLKKEERPPVGEVIFRFSEMLPPDAF